MASGPDPDMNRTAVVAGVGPGVGEAVARRLAAAGYGVGLLARSPDSDFAGAVGADRLADRYLELLDRDGGFAVERLEPA